MEKDHDRWWEKSGDDLGGAVWDLGKSLRDDQKDVELRAKYALRLYEGSTSSGLAGGRWHGDGDVDFDVEDLDFNLSRAACDTVHAEIAGRQKPVAKFQTSDADWKTKRRAKKMEKFCRAVIHQRQNQYLNAWELMESAFLDCAVWGMGVAKVFAKGEKICIERHFAHELFVDPHEARYGSPRNLFHVYVMEKDLALKCFVEETDLPEDRKNRLRLAIAAAESERGYDDGDGDTVSLRAAQTIRIVEAWRLPHEKKGGKHVFAVEGTLLHEEEWARESFPFVFMRWEPARIGWRAKGLVEQGESIHRETNFNAQKLQTRFKLCGAKRTYFVEGSIDENLLEANDDEVFIPVSGGVDMPKETTPKPIADAELEWLVFNYEKYWQLTGVSEMRAQARKEPGVTAGVAIRTLNDMQTARFALKAKTYENAFVDLAQQIICCAREMASGDHDLTVRYDKEIKWSEVEMPEDTFDITIAPTSSLPNDPAGRMQMTQELYSAGIIQVETFKQLLGWPDLEKEMNFQTAQRKYIERRVDEMLDGGEYEDPDPHIIDKQGALIQVGQAYLDALYDDAPDENLRLLSQYMQELDHMIAEGMRAAAMAQAQLQQEIQQTMGGAPPAGGAQPPNANRPPVAPVEEATHAA